MQITCPACQATYEVPDRMIAPGRRVRCAKCGEPWLPASNEPETPMEAVLAAMAAPPPDQGGMAGAAAGGVVPSEFPTLPPEDWPADSPALFGMPSHAGPPGSARGRYSPWPLRLAWAASVLLLLGLGAAAWLYRSPISIAWPPTMRLYALLGG
jgi:predicted Zn finger-like uncharacterized protein